MLPDPFPPPEEACSGQHGDQGEIVGWGAAKQCPCSRTGKRGPRNSLSSLQNYLGGNVEGERLLCLWVQPLGLITHTNQARGASLSPVFHVHSSPNPPPGTVLPRRKGRPVLTLTSLRQTPIGTHFQRLGSVFPSIPCLRNHNDDQVLLPLSSTFSVPGMVLCASLYYMTILILLLENGGSERESGLSKVTQHVSD